MLARENPDENVVGIVHAVRAAVARAQPALAEDVVDVEDAQVVAQVGDRIHGDGVVAGGLVRILIRQCQTSFSHALLQAVALGTLDDRIVTGVALEAKLAGAGSDQVDLDLRSADGSLVGQLVGVVANLATLGLDGLSVGVHRFVSAEDDGLPDLELRTETEGLLEVLAHGHGTILDRSDQIRQVAVVKNLEVLRRRLLLTDDGQRVRGLSERARLGLDGAHRFSYGALLPKGSMLPVG